MGKWERSVRLEGVVVAGVLSYEEAVRRNFIYGCYGSYRGKKPYCCRKNVEGGDSVCESCKEMTTNTKYELDKVLFGRWRQQ